MLANPSMDHTLTPKRYSTAFIVGCILALNSATCAAFEFKLSTLFGFFEEEEERFERPIYPRRNLVEDYGEDGYRALVSRALNQDPTEKVEDNAIDIYGVDVSFPTHYLEFPQHDGMESAEQPYASFLQGCKAYYRSKPDTCDESEMDRLDRNLNQPPVMQVWHIGPIFSLSFSL